MRIAVYGVGGVGGFLGAQLARAGEHVALIARGPHLDAIRRQGLCVTSPSGEMLVQPALATDDPREAGIVDVVILGVKAHQVSAAAAAIRPMLGHESFVLPLQNGVEAASQLVPLLGEAHVVAGLCGMMSWKAAPGHIRTLGEVNFVRFGELDNRLSQRIVELCEVFVRAGIKAEIPADIHQALWEKFLFIASVGGVGAVTRQTFGMIREDPESRRMLELAMREIFDLARRRGIALEEGIVERTLAFFGELPAEGTSSMHRDIEAGRPSELEAWNGAVVRLAAQSGVAVPVNRLIYEKLLVAEREAPLAIR